MPYTPSHLCISAGDVPAVLRLVGPHLMAAAPACGPASGHAPAAVALAYLRACKAALALMQPKDCAAHAQLVQGVAEQCAAAVAATAAPPQPAASQQQPAVTAVTAGSFQATDFWDPMRSVMLKEAGRVWLGVGLECSALTGSPTASDSAEVFAELLQQRLAACLASQSYDVRAAACKALVDTAHR